MLIVLLMAGTLVSGSAVSSAQDSGSTLVEEVLPHEVGENAQVRLEDVADFSPDGGDAVFEPGTGNEETFSYDGVDLETNRLLGLDRAAPGSHEVGTPVVPVVPLAETPAPAPVQSPSPTQSSSPTEDPASSPAGSSSPEETTSSGGAPRNQTILNDVCDSVFGGSCDEQLGPVVGDPCGVSSLLCDSPDLTALCDPDRAALSCEEYLNGLCQTRAALPECARELLNLINLSYDSALEGVFDQAIAPVDARFCTDRTLCDAVIQAVAALVAQEIRADCSDDDLTCLNLYVGDVNRVDTSLSTLLCSSDGCAAYVSDMIVTGIAENLRISGTFVSEMLNGLPTDPTQLEISVARDAELPDPTIEPLLDLVFGGPGTAATDDNPGSSDGPGGAQTITGNGDGKRRCTFRGTSYNKGAKNLGGAEDPSDTATTGSGTFGYTDDYIGANADAMAYVHSPANAGQSEYQSQWSIAGVKFKYVKGKYSKNEILSSYLEFPWHVNGELRANTTWSIIPLPGPFGGTFSAEARADVTVNVGYTDLTSYLRAHGQVFHDVADSNEHKFPSAADRVPYHIYLEPGHTYAVWIEVHSAAESWAAFSTHGESEAFFASDRGPDARPDNETRRAAWLEHVTLITEKRVRCGGSA